jgi:hypothetical protein
MESLCYRQRRIGATQSGVVKDYQIKSRFIYSKSCPFSADSFG